MPWRVERDTNACPISKPFAVVKIADGSKVACHATKEGAEAQKRALYASLRKEGGYKMKEYFLAPVEKLFGDNPPTPNDRIRWVQAFPYGTWSHPIYGDTTVTPEIASRYVKNFKDNVRGVDLAVGYNHGEDKSKGDKAAGWIRAVEARDDGIYHLVEFTENAITELSNGEWKYYSSESFDEWKNPMNGQKYQYVFAGGSLTNKPWVKGMLPINFSEVMTEEDLKEVEAELVVKAESKELEHSEPGTGNPPVPRTDGDGHDEKDREEGWRRPDLPTTFPDTLKQELERGNGRVDEKTELKLRQMFDVDENGDLLEAIQLKFGELDSIKKQMAAADQEKQFAEEYPQFWQEHNKLMERDRENSAKNFSESVSQVRKAEGYGLKDTRLAMSAKAKDEVTEVHKKFSSGTATVEDFEGCIKAIMNGGLLEFGEIGSGKDGEEVIPQYDTTTPNGVAAARQLFGELMNKEQEEHPDWDFEKAFNEISKKHPDLAEAYQVTLPA